MRLSTGHVLNALRSMEQMLEVAVAAGTGFGFWNARRRLNGAAAALVALSETQDHHARRVRALSPRVRELYTELRSDHLRPIVEIAKRKLAPGTGCGVLAMPRRGVCATELVLAARVMGHAIAPHSRACVALGGQADFIARLDVAAGALEEAEYARRRAISGRRQATAALSAEERQGRSVIKVVDALVRPRIRSDAVLLARWKEVTKIGVVGRQRAAARRRPKSGRTAA